MTVLTVPALDKVLWPTLGPAVCDFIESWLIYGPGDLLGEPARLDPEQRFLIYRMYEVYPQGHAQAGRRRFKRVAISQRKGTAKTEFGAWVAACELHPDAPVRVVDWHDDGTPIGDGVTDPYIPMVAYTEEQSEELAFGTLLAVIGEGPLAEDFDVGLERIMRLDGAGKAVAIATAPDASDGARTSLQLFDESHRLVLPRHRETHRTMLANIPKQKAADAWSLELTVAPQPGQGSIAEKAMDYAKTIAEGKMSDPRLFFFHRQASDEHDLSTDEGVRAAVLEASGPAAEWSDIEGIVEQWRDPTSDKAYLERVWLNRLVQASDRAFNSSRWAELATDQDVEEGTMITLGFDGSRSQDATGIVATDILTGYQWVVGAWQRPERVDDWEVPAEEVDDCLEGAFGTWEVWRLYADPYYWQTDLARWSGRWPEKVVAFQTNQWRRMSQAVQNFNTAIATGELSHSGDERLAAHVGAACRRDLSIRDAEGHPAWVIQKERQDSPHKIDLAMAAILSWQARTDAIALDVLKGAEPFILV